MIRLIRRATRGIATLRQDQTGLALVEFAIALPVLLTLYLGGWQLQDAISCNRKVTVTARTVADLVSQYSAIPQANIVSIIGTSTQVMAPYDATNAKIIVSQLYTDNNGITTVNWSESSANTSRRVIGSNFSLPTSMISTNTYLIYAEVTYSYTPAVLYGTTGPITMGNSVYMSPRISSSVSET